MRKKHRKATGHGAEILDPTWHQGMHSEGRGSKVEEEVVVAQHVTSRGSGVTEDKRRTVHMASGKIPRSSDLHPSSRPSLRTSSVWPFFEECDDNRTLVSCKLCHVKLSRGVNGRSLCTSSMRRHMSAKHSLEWSEQQHKSEQIASFATQLLVSSSESEPVDPGPRPSNSDQAKSQPQCGPIEMGHAKLFKHYFPCASTGHIHSPVVVEEEEEEGSCDAQPPLPEDKDGGGPVHDHEILDPTWHEGMHSEGSSSKVEEEVVVSQHVTSRGSGMAGNKRQAIHVASIKIPRSFDLRPSCRPTVRRTSGAWAFFDESADERTLVFCKLCRVKLSRGVNSRNLNTTSMRNHLSAKHPLEWSEHQRKSKQIASFVTQLKVSSSEPVDPDPHPSTSDHAKSQSQCGPTKKRHSELLKHDFLSKGKDAGGPVHMLGPLRQLSAKVDDDQTQLSFSDVEVVSEGEEVAEEVIDNPDDEIRDPTWHKGMQSEGSGSEEEVVVAQQVTSRGNGVTGDKRQAIHMASRKKSRNSDLRPSSVPSGRTSVVWVFFDDIVDDRTLVSCKLCHVKLSRGVNGRNLNTTSMRRHMAAKHSLQWNEHQRKVSKNPGAPSPSAGNLTDYFSTSNAADPDASQARCTTPPPLTPTPPAPLSVSIDSQASGQLSIPQLDRKRKFPATHQQAQALNDAISKLLAQQKLPLKLVETDSFKDLMELAVPQYAVPSRHYFARKAIPALHEHVTRNIKHALNNAVSGKVHLTTDTWTSKCGQGRYISLTAHWVNVVEDGSDMADVLPTPRIAGHRSVRVSSTSYSSFEFPSPLTSFPTGERQRSITQCSAAMGKRQQAVLRLICLGENSHSAQELWKGIQDQCDGWFLPLHLQPGLVVCDSGRNLVAALGLGELPHIPCLAHVLNLVVQRFLKYYPGLPQLLRKVRTICSLIHWSHPAASALASLQRTLHLPVHRLICDVSTRWNSTLHMLARLSEQQRAVIEFQLQRAHTSHQSQLPDITASEWAWIKDICAVLRCFEDVTKMASANDAIVSLTIPLLILLETMLQGIKDNALEQEEENITPGAEDSGCVGSSEQGGFDEQWQGTPPQLCSQGTLLKEEEDDDDDEGQYTQESGTLTGLSPFVERGWGDGEEPESTPSSVADGSLAEGSLAHMTDFMLWCLRNDRRIEHIFGNNDYWVATLLDPRYKENFQTLIPELERDCKMRTYQAALVSSLHRSFGVESGDVRARHGSAVGPQGGGNGHRSRSSDTNVGKGRLAKAWEKFLSPPHRPAPSETNAISRRLYFTKMVQEYLSTQISVQHDASVPFNFWVSKMDTWPELSLYALEVLACPAASVLSERAVSAASSIISNRCTSLPTDNVDWLTLIKMNQLWIGPEFATPPAEATTDAN